MPNISASHGFESQQQHKRSKHIHSDNNNTVDVSEFFLSIKKDADAATKLAGVMKKESIQKFVEIINQCDGTLLTSGIGKSGIIAHRMSTSLSSTGVPAHYVHSAEWNHGDIGKARRDDVCVFFSHSGNTRECVFAATLLKQKGVHILSIIGHEDSQLAKCSDAYLCYQLDHDLKEPIGGVPTTSVVLQEMIVNAVVCELIKRRRFTKIEFARNHPGGSLGKKLCEK